MSLSRGLRVGGACSSRAQYYIHQARYHKQIGGTVGTKNIDLLLDKDAHVHRPMLQYALFIHIVQLSSIHPDGFRPSLHLHLCIILPPFYKTLHKSIPPIFLSAHSLASRIPLSVLTKIHSPGFLRPFTYPVSFPLASVAMPSASI